MTEEPFVRLVGKKIRVRVSELYLKQNWGVPFLIAFVGLLLVAIAASTSWATQAAAESDATYAGYALFLGVVLQIASFLKYQRRD